MKKIIHICSMLIASIICSGCATSESYSNSNELRYPQGPMYSEGNANGIDNVFDEIIHYAKMQDKKKLTSLQREEYSFSKLYGRDIYITTKVDDVGYSSIKGYNRKESWRRDSFNFAHPIWYNFKFNNESEDKKLFSTLNKRDIVNIKGKVKEIETRIAGGGSHYATFLHIDIEECEFFD